MALPADWGRGEVCPAPEEGRGEACPRGRGEEYPPDPPRGDICPDVTVAAGGFL